MTASNTGNELIEVSKQGELLDVPLGNIRLCFHEEKATKVIDFFRGLALSDSEWQEFPVDRRVEVQVTGKVVQFFSEGIGSEYLDLANLKTLCSELESLVSG